MTRRLLTLFAPGLLMAQTKVKKKYYITWPFYTAPIVVYGHSRTDALINSGATVWTEEEWILEAEWSRKRFHGEEPKR